MQLIGFPFFESQAKWIAQLLSGKRALPSSDDMMQSIKDFYQSRDLAGIPKHNTHDLADFEVKINHSISLYKKKIKNLLSQYSNCITIVVTVINSIRQTYIACTPSYNLILSGFDCSIVIDMEIMWNSHT